MSSLQAQRVRSNRRLMLAIALFVLFDLGTLAFNFQIAHQVEQDAVAINLSGRQRMLSQRTTKAALLATLPERTAGLRQASAEEAQAAWKLFRHTLDAFEHGGMATGGNGRPAELHAVEGAAIPLVRQAQQLAAQAQDVDIDTLVRFASDNNDELLRLMNALTSELERQSVAAVARLRLAQTLAFCLSLGNFFLILREMQRARRRAEREAVTDPLTRLLNRGGLYASLERALAHYRETGEPLGVILLDLDGFKAVNDTCGHAAGDDALVETARRINEWLPEGWRAGRLGGDEFAVICRGADEAQLQQMAERLDMQLADIPVGGCRVSASVGYASASAVADCSADALMAAADAAMFVHKNEKRHFHIRRPPRNS